MIQLNEYQPRVSAKLYCYVDETGQDTKGKLFLVVVVLQEVNNLLFLISFLMNIEKETGKRWLKWRKTKRAIKNNYLEQLLLTKRLKKSIFYSIYQDSKEYSQLTTLTIAKAILASDYQNYSLTIVIDGLNTKERDLIKTGLKKLKIKYHKVRGMKDEQDVFLRLADAMAGFLRDALEGQEYAEIFFKRFSSLQIVTKI